LNSNNAPFFMKRGCVMIPFTKIQPILFFLEFYLCLGSLLLLQI